MKKNNRFQINPGKVLKNEELIALKGGVDCYCYDANGNITGGGTAGSAEVCREMCNALQNM